MRHPGIRTALVILLIGWACIVIIAAHAFFVGAAK